MQKGVSIEVCQPDAGYREIVLCRSVILRMLGECEDFERLCLAVCHRPHCLIEVGPFSVKYDDQARDGHLV
jgi:hypothetical protein